LWMIKEGTNQKKLKQRKFIWLSSESPSQEQEKIEESPKRTSPAKTRKPNKPISETDQKHPKIPKKHVKG
jgi:hypothetical protein